MAPQTKSIQGGKPASTQNLVESAYKTLTSVENQTVVKSVAMFGVAVAFFASSFSEYLLPPDA